MGGGTAGAETCRACPSLCRSWCRCSSCGTGQWCPLPVCRCRPGLHAGSVVHRAIHRVWMTQTAGRRRPPERDPPARGRRCHLGPTTGGSVEPVRMSSERSQLEDTYTQHTFHRPRSRGPWVGHLTLGVVVRLRPTVLVLAMAKATAQRPTTQREPFPGLPHVTSAGTSRVRMPKHDPCQPSPGTSVSSITRHKTCLSGSAAGSLPGSAVCDPLSCVSAAVRTFLTPSRRRLRRRARIRVLARSLAAGRSSPSRYPRPHRTSQNRFSTNSTRTLFIQVR